MSSDLPEVYLQIVMRRYGENRLAESGIYVGDDPKTYPAAARASRDQNITLLDQPIRKILAAMQADEFRVT